ncbi:DUF1566 domain-containing protein [candidate division KSB1 bacterium]|nr:DUF1566 domain-containing protein [bacterium]NUM68853.1 DUF1566 domain-containing protein [candidate division KSB1 bacterium]
MSFSPEAIIGILGALASVVTAIFGYPVWKQWRTQRLLEKSFGAELYDRGTIERSTHYYIRPNCSSIDPAQEAEIRQVVVTKEGLFEKIDEYLSVEPHSRHLLLLADSGMGKSSFVLNYYADNQDRAKRSRHRLAVIPLGIPNVNEVIAKIDNKRDTVIFLDAFDEDTQAIKDHRDRLFELMEACREFKRVLITCRTQFFPSDEEIPKETGIARIGPRRLGQSRVYEFWKLYLTPLTDAQVDLYIRKRYSIFRPDKRKKARELVQKIPLLSVRPMLLAYIPDLLDSNTNIEHSFQLYDIMVEKWFEREKGWVPPESLRAFSERLAVDLYLNREKRGAERIAGAELLPLAREWKINLDDWQLRGRSLLNRDAGGNYKFAHRSIMEYLFVKQFLAGEKACTGLKWTDQMKRFLVEIVRHQWRTQHKLECDLAKVDLTESEPPFVLRATEKRLSTGEVKHMLESVDLFATDWNKNARGLPHVYEIRDRSGVKVVVDHATGLMWQQGGSNDSMRFGDAEKHIQKLNRERFAGYNDWRLPTLEEAMSLMEPTKKNGDLYIDPVFDKTQRWIWTADKGSAGVAWVVLFDSGDCSTHNVTNGNHVRAVRSGQS